MFSDMSYMIMHKDNVIIYLALCTMAGKELLGWALQIGEESKPFCKLCH